MFSQLATSQIYNGFGVKAGTSIANQQSAQDFGQLYYKIGFAGGVFKETVIFDKLNLVVGINYVQKGFRVEMVNTSETGKYLGLLYYNQNINFITSELILKYDGNKEKLSPYVLAGLRMDFMVSHSYTLDGEKQPFEFLSFDGNKVFGGILGFGLSFKPAKLYTLFIEGTYNPDFTNLIERSHVNTPEYKLWTRGNSFDIRAGIKF